jgi:hypothetical protein
MSPLLQIGVIALELADPELKETHMRPVGLLPALLLGLVAGQVAFGAEPSVTLTICNAGKVDLDAYLVRPGSTLTSHIAPAKCGVLEKVDGPAKPGTIAFGFADTKGQWAGVRRTDVWPDGIDSVFHAVNQTLTVKHGAANASIAGLVSYTSATPYCAPAGEGTMSVPTPQYPGQRVAPIPAAGFDPSKGPLVCHDMSYSLTVIPFADSHELAFDTHCYPCESPEDRAALENLTASDLFGPIANLPDRGGPIGRGILNLGQSSLDQDKAERARRDQIAKGPYLMNWKDLSSFITSAFGMQGPLMTNRHILLRGTVSRVELPKPGAEIPYVHVYFKEAGTMEKPVANLPGDYFINKYIGTDQTFSVCATDAGVYRDTFGADFVTAMVGKSVEIEGEVNSGTCGTAAGIRMDLARQLKQVTPGMPIAAGQTWVPTLRPSQQPVAPPITTASATPLPPPVTLSREEAARAAANRPVNNNVARGTQPAQTPAARTPVTTAPVAPAPAPVAPAQNVPASQVRDPLINNVVSLLKAKLPEKQIMLMLKQRNRPVKLTGADRAELEDAGASEKLIDAIINPASIGP